MTTTIVPDLNITTTFIPGWCAGCSRAQGIYVAVALGMIGLGVLFGLIAMIWGIYRGNKKAAGKM